MEVRALPPERMGRPGAGYGPGQVTTSHSPDSNGGGRDVDLSEVRLVMSPTKPSGPRRRCAREGCDTVLSSYNPEERCHAHQEPAPISSAIR